MSNTIPSPNMSLPVPIVGVDAGPDWANNYNSCLSILDQHNHSVGSGVQITPNGLNINQDLNFNDTNGTNFRSVRFQSQGSLLSLGTDLGCLYESNVDLYYNDGSGNQIRLTQSGSIAGTPGSITGLVSPASVTYAGGTYTFQSTTATPANIDAGSYVFRNNVANSKGLTLSPPNAMAADYGLVLPALPAAQSFMAIDTSGNVTAFANVSQGITASMILDGTITGAKIGAVTIGGGNIINKTITGLQITDTLTLGGTLTATSSITSGGPLFTPQIVLGGTAIFDIFNSNVRINNAGLQIGSLGGVFTNPSSTNINFSGNISVGSRAAIGQTSTGSTNSLAVRDSSYANPFPIVVSEQPTSGNNGWLLIRGFVDSAGNSPGSGSSLGEGWSCSQSLGVFTISFTHTLTTTPIILVTLTATNGNTVTYQYAVSSVSTTGFVVSTFNGNNNPNALSFSFVVFGQR